MALNAFRSRSLVRAAAVLFLCLASGAAHAQVLAAETFSSFTPAVTPPFLDCGKESLSNATNGMKFRTSPALQIIDDVSTQGNANVCRPRWYFEKDQPRGELRHYRYWVYPVEAAGGFIAGFAALGNVNALVQFYGTPEGPFFTAIISNTTTPKMQKRTFLGAWNAWHLITISIGTNALGQSVGLFQVEAETNPKPFSWVWTFDQLTSFDYQAFVGETEGEDATGTLFNATGTYFVDDAFIFKSLEPPAHRLTIQSGAAPQNACATVDVGAAFGDVQRPFIDWKDQSGAMQGAANEVMVTATNGLLYADSNCKGVGSSNLTVRIDGGVLLERFGLTAAGSETVSISAVSPSYLAAVPLSVPVKDLLSPAPFWGCSESPLGLTLFAAVMGWLAAIRARRSATRPGRGTH